MIGVPKFVIVIPSYNNEAYVEKNLFSIFGQKYPYYRVIYLDDNSLDKTNSLVKEIVTKVNKWDIFSLYRQRVRCYASGNRYFAYHLCKDDEILVMLDGDDWFSNRNVLTRLSIEYQKGSLVTYGSYRFYENNRISGGIYGNEIFPNEVLKNRTFRHYRWTSQHLRTGYARLFKQIKIVDLMDLENNFLRCCTDLAEMMPVLEMASPKITMIPEPLYIYNKDASLENNNSFFNQKKNPIERVYREYVENKIKTTNNYSNKKKSHPMIDKKIPEQYRENLSKLLTATGLNYLGLKQPLTHSINLFHPEIKIGYFNGKRIISIDKPNVNIWFLSKD